LSLAVELLSDPSVLLVDEPTSGLDAYNAKSVMEVLRDIADSGRTVIVSIHQPSSEIWSSFDDVLLLAKGGRTVAYARREDALPVFAAAGYECPAFYNPADFLLDTIAIDARSAQAKETTSDRLNNIIANIQASNQAKKLEEGSVGVSNNLVDHQQHDTKTSSVGDYPSQAFRVAFPVVLQRAFKNLRRQKDVFVVRLFNPPFLALLFWLFFLRLSKGPSGAQNRVGLLQENSALPFVGMLTSVAIFPKVSRVMHIAGHS
jgi:energy-coupling factor transporter ATP-binding protein EcfA2